MDFFPDFKFIVVSAIVYNNLKLSIIKGQPLKIGLRPYRND